MADPRRRAPATERNRGPIADIIGPLLPAGATILEVASGTGEHAAYLAGRFPDRTWQPSDRDEAALASIAAWRDEAGLANLRAPLRLDAAAADWPVVDAGAVLCINMVHISPWAATEGLMRGARRLLAPGAPLILYGPYLRAGTPTAPSNIDFDSSLKARDPEWGLREVAAVAAEAGARGMDFEHLFEMPANNLILLFRRR
jgi:SAM-dependent methyltransferase